LMAARKKGPWRNSATIPSVLNSPFVNNRIHLC